MSMQSTSPASFIGGSWERITDKFLIGCQSSSYPVGTTGGTDNHTHTVNNHTLTEQQIPVLSGNITMHSAENAKVGSIFWSPTGVFS